MPPYAFLAERKLETRGIADQLWANSKVGVPYSADEMKNAEADLVAQATPDADVEALLKRYPKAQARDFDGNPAMVSEMDALIAYLQVLGTMVDFSTYQPGDNER